LDLINKKVKNGLTISVISSLLLVVGILGLTLGLGFGLLYVWIPGLVLLGVNFYLCPIVWTTIYAVNVHRKAVCQLILENNYRDIEIIAQTLSSRVNIIKRDISYLISHLYLKGFVIKGTKLESVLPEPTKVPDVQIYKCPSCGGSISPDVDKTCPYCGAKLVIRKN
jgi:hypothetical protein